MKTFNYKLGHEAGKTVTVSELKSALEKYPSDMPVLATWEGIHVFIDVSELEVEDYHTGDISQSCKCLVISAEN